MRLGKWRKDAACRGEDISVFFPEDGNYATARRWCADCPVKRDCLEEALSHSDDWYGMFGGKTPRERENIRWSRMTNRPMYGRGAHD